MTITQGTYRQEQEQKLKLLQYTESLRHLQTLEAVEMGFLIPAYGAAIVGVVNDPLALIKSQLQRSGRRRFHRVWPF